MCSNAKQKKNIHTSGSNTVPIVYHPDYNIGLFGLENYHPFDSKKYGRVYERIKTQLNLSPSDFVKPAAQVSVAELLKVHTPEYLQSLKSSSVVAQITEIGELSYVPNFLLQWYLLTPMRLATQGTLDAVDEAIKHNWAINLGGGYHHAKSDSGGGFCAYADIPLAVKKLINKYHKKKILIVDLDAHQGNGHEEILCHDKHVAIFDVYNENIYPRDEQAKKCITYNHPITSETSDSEYLNLLKKELSKAFNASKPDFIVYNAGTDIYEHDPLGRLKISRKGIIERDQMVFELAKKHAIPILMVLSGGYTKASAGIIADSIINLINKKIITLRKTGF